MKECLDYQHEIQNKEIEGLLEEFQQLIEEKQYHNLSSHNDKLEKKCDQKIFLVKLKILEEVEILKDCISTICV
ncbi:hypothetical protein [Clostridium sp. CTA-6]